MKNYTVKIHGRKVGAIGQPWWEIVPVQLEDGATAEDVLNAVRDQRGIEFCAPSYTTNEPLLVWCEAGDEHSPEKWITAGGAK